jgi:elongation factor Ts
MPITMEEIKTLRERTGAGVMDVKAALAESDGNIERAVEILRKKGAASAVKKSGRDAKEGWIGSYVHSNGKIGVIVEINCETDFVARNADFQEFTKTIAMQIAATDPLVVKPEDVSEELVNKEKEIAIEQLKAEGKPEAMFDKILEGKMKKFREERALITQPFIKDQDKTVGDLLSEAVAKIGENIQIGRFKRIEIGKE